MATISSFKVRVTVKNNRSTPILDYIECYIWLKINGVEQIGIPGSTDGVAPGQTRQLSLITVPTTAYIFQGKVQRVFPKGDISFRAALAEYPPPAYAFKLIGEYQSPVIGQNY